MIDNLSPYNSIFAGATWLRNPGNLTQAKTAFDGMGMPKDELITEIKKSKNEG